MIYPVTSSPTGQQIASGQIINYLSRQEEFTVRSFQLKGYDRTSIKMPICVIKFVWQTVKLWTYLLRLLFYKPTAVYLNLGQSWMTFLRIGIWYSLLLRIRKNHYGIISLHGHWFTNWTTQSILSKTFVWILRPAEVITVLGNSQEISLIKQGISPDNIRIVPNTSTIDPLELDAISEKHNENSIKILFLSNLIPSKGFIEYIDTINQLSKLNLQIKVEAILCVKEMKCGYSEDFNCHSYLKQAIDEINLSSQVTLKHVPGAYGSLKQKLYRQSHIFILPSRIEGQPLVLLEAMASGCVPIATAVGEIPSIINDNEGILIDRPAPSLILKCILKLINEQTERKEMALNAASSYRSNFSISNYHQNWQSIFNEYKTTLSRDFHI
ncbi:MAG: glycosyltransferase family 4 protein [Lentisphaerae bacterium]|nr:glycosyltransferase family 4 protein [Lentisphaerota bacterium]